eukprot:CAMPEP_0114240700 /NCGR_PEP_ID=MMETSP0058-20121206/9234_1 /TAXON_ID=36894 /ORGANISM="Pyramimonas parkeae, CCMP726" /LENGTH=419 /DNA_ID=CAMNT_0001353167 /DNA_START=446 /DNA_END=1705 /DNA_ORIENTATION=-
MAQEKFLNWCNSKGIAAPKMQIFETANGYRGLRATEMIKEGEVAVVVPREACLTSEDPGSELDGQDSGGKATTRMYLRLYNEMCTHALERASAWAPYLDTIPSRPVGALGFDEDTLSAFQHAGLSERTATWSAEVDALFWEATGLTPREDPEGVLLARWRVAVSLAHSRGMTMEHATAPGAVARNQLFMAPLADLLNHSAEYIPNFAWRWSYEEDALCVYANEDVHPMEEAFISYGPELSSDDLVVFYGFLLPENPHDKAWVFDSLCHAAEWLVEYFADMFRRQPRSGLDTTVARALAQQMLEEREIEQKLTGEVDPPDRLYIRQDGEVDDRLEELFERLLEYEIDDQDVYTMGRGCIGFRCGQLLQTYSTSLVEDMSILYEGEQSLSDDYNKQLAIKHRITIKKTLSECADWSDLLRT